jgi:hypothetical protein
MKEIEYIFKLFIAMMQINTRQKQLSVTKNPITAMQEPKM